MRGTAVDLSVIIFDFDRRWAGVSPDEADMPLIIHSDAVLTGTVAGQPLQPVGRRGAEVEKGPSGGEHVEFPDGRACDVLEAAVPARTTELFGVIAGKRLDCHYVTRNMWQVKGQAGGI